MIDRARYDRGMAETRAARPGALETRTPDAAERVRAVSGEQLLPLLEHLARVGRRSAEAGMSGSLRPRHLIALRVIGEYGPMTQHAVAVALSLDPSNVVGLLNELEERDLISRRRDPADRRRHIVELSAAGSGEVTQAYDKLSQVEDDLFRSLTADERGTLYTLLARAVETSASACEPSPCAVADPAPFLEPAPRVEPGPAICLADDES
jgi:DNA-binding MarR family transcriptional regulator